MIGRASLSLLACVGLLAAVACTPEQQPPPQAPQTTAGTPEGQYTAADTFGVLRAIHAGEIDQGMLAQRKATDPRVRAFAEKVVNDHKARMQKDEQLMSGLDIKARDSDLSSQIKSASDRQVSKLDSMSGNEFDREYLDNQISYYRMVLDTMDRNLVPSARDPQIRASLQNARERANEHLREAQDLRASLSTATP